MPARSRRRRTVHAFDTDVVVRRPVAAGLACLLTLGISGAVHHHRTTSELARFGRARGAMPFPFIQVKAGASTLAWVAGLLLWWGFVAGMVGFSVELASGSEQPSPDDITLFASLGILLAPAWIVALHAMRRIRTARHMVGTSGAMPSLLRAAALATLLPPLGTWNAQRELNRAWREWQA